VVEGTVNCKSSAYNWERKKFRKLEHTMSRFGWLKVLRLDIQSYDINISRFTY
jgi:hypothetical protein